MTCKARNDGNGYVRCEWCGTADHEFYFSCNREEAPLGVKVAFVAGLLLLGWIVFLLLNS